MLEPKGDHFLDQASREIKVDPRSYFMKGKDGMDGQA